MLGVVEICVAYLKHVCAIEMNIVVMAFLALNSCVG